MTPQAEITVTEPALLVRLTQSYQDGMSDVALYEATRGVWRLGPRRVGVAIALAVNQGIVRAVYVIDGWHRGGTTPYSTRVISDPRRTARWEFTGAAAEPALWNRYVGRSVASYFPRGCQNPVVYVNVA